MTQVFKGKIALDVRDSEPDWEPYLAPKAAAGAPNVLIIAWDDLGYATMDTFGGPVSMPQHSHRRPWREVRQLPHHGAVLAHPCVVVDGPERDVERHGHDRRVRVGVASHDRRARPRGGARLHGRALARARGATARRAARRARAHRAGRHDRRRQSGRRRARRISRDSARTSRPTAASASTSRWSSATPACAMP